MKEPITKMLKEKFPSLTEDDITFIGIFAAKAEKHYRTLYARRIVEALFKPDQEAAYKEALTLALAIIIRFVPETSHPEDYEWACTTYKNVTGREPEELFK